MTKVAGPGVASPTEDLKLDVANTSSPPRHPRRVRAAVGVLLFGGLSIAVAGCAAAVGAAMAVGEIREGFAGVQQLITRSRQVQESEVQLPPSLAAPIAGTYRAFQALGGDTIHYFLRTSQRPTTPIVDAAGNVTGYALSGLVAVTLDTLEARAGRRVMGVVEPAGHSVFFVEGTHPPNANSRTLYPAAFLGRPAPGESASVDRLHAELARLDLDMAAPPAGEMVSRRIPHELFSTVAEGIFTISADAGAVYRQESATEDGRTLILHFERISHTTLPAGG